MSYTISTDKSLLNLPIIHNYLSNVSYWAKGVSLAQVQKAVDNSLCFGVYYKGQQIGLARVVTDYVRMAYIADVFILEEHQGAGLGKQLIETILTYPDLAECTRWMLLTKDAHGLYQQYGFVEPSNPEMYMERTGKVQVSRPSSNSQNVEN